MATKAAKFEESRYQLRGNGGYVDGDWTKEELERFWSKIWVRHTGECWDWVGGKCGTSHNRGNFSIRGRWYQSHRFSFLLHNGYLPPQVHHTCENPLCVNPAHLEARESIWDHLSGHRKKTCRRGHDKYSHPQWKVTIQRKDGTPYEVVRCRQCHLENQRKYRAMRAVSR